MTGTSDAHRDRLAAGPPGRCGVGAFAKAAAPAITQLVGGAPPTETEFTLRMHEVAVKESGVFRVRALYFRGVPPGVDIRTLVEARCEPQIGTGISRRLVGIGQIGARLTEASIHCFTKAVEAFASRRRLEPY